MSRLNIEDLLDRYLKQQTTAEEKELVEQWLADYNSASAWEDMNVNARKVWLNELFHEVQQSINADTSISIKPVTKSYPWLKYVAAIAAIVAIFCTLYITWPTINNKIIPESFTTLQVSLNQTRQIILSDGSRIWVNAGSELRYPKTFAGKNREVFLTGEAYFDIHHNTKKPFIVHTGSLVTTVLGTAFNIKAFKPAEAVIVTVTRGKVSVANGTQFLGYLTPNRQLTFNKIKQQSVQKVVNADEVIAWQKESEIHFDDITFGEAAKQLEQRFKISIGFKNDNVKNCRFSGTALKGNDLDQILGVICAFNKASYYRNQDNSIIIEGQGCIN